MALLVVLGHCISVIGSNDKLLWMVLIYIYSLHMPMFFVAAGYTLNIKRNLYQFINTKLKNIMIPYIEFAVIITLFQVLFKEYSYIDIISNIKANFLDIILMTTKSRYASLWFLPTITFALCISFVIEKYIRNKKWVIFISVVLLLINQIWYLKGIESIWGIREALLAQFFILMGYELKENIREVFEKTNYSIMWTSALMWVYGITEWLRSKDCIISYWNTNIQPITWTIPLAASGITFFIALISVWKRYKGNIYKAFIYFGQISIYIYGFHYIFLRTIPRYVSENINCIIRVLIITSSVLILSLITTEIYLMFRFLLTSKNNRVV